MRDARTNASTHTQSAAARAISREVKKLTWFQRNILCMNVEIHQENYQAYVECKAIMDTQQMILHHVSGS
jgi:aminoglycoside/choline kinase family phosphotransferase